MKWYCFLGNSDLYNLTSAETIEVFYKLRMDIEKLSYAALMLRIINDVCVEGETSYKKLQLLDDKTIKVIYLRITGELSFKEIGIILNKTENWARVTFYRGKNQLKEVN